MRLRVRDLFSPFVEHGLLLLPAQNPNEQCIPGEMTEGIPGVIDAITGRIRCYLFALKCEMCLHRDDRRDLRDDRRDLRDDRRDDRIRLKPLFDICVLVIVSHPYFSLLLCPILIFTTTRSRSPPRGGGSECYRCNRSVGDATGI